MGIVKNLIGGLTGSSAAKASTQAAGIQSDAANRAIDFQKETLDTVRKDFEPYRDLGTRNISGYEKLITDPNAKLDFIQNNPFFDALTKKATTTLTNNAATKGKLASGGTAEALQNSLLLIGNDLVNENIAQRGNLVNIGQNSAAQTGSATLSTGNNISNLLTDQGNARASGVIGKANAYTDAAQNLLSTGATAYALSDKREKKDIKKVGKLDNGLPVYTFKYKGSKETRMNVMAQDVEKKNPAAILEKAGRKYVHMKKATEK